VRVQGGKESSTDSMLLFTPVTTSYASDHARCRYRLRRLLSLFATPTATITSRRCRPSRRAMPRAAPTTINEYIRMRRAPSFARRFDRSDGWQRHDIPNHRRHDEAITAAEMLELMRVKECRRGAMAVVQRKRCAAPIYATETKEKDCAKRGRCAKRTMPFHIPFDACLRAGRPRAWQLRVPI